MYAVRNNPLLELERTGSSGNTYRRTHQLRDLRQAATLLENTMKAIIKYNFETNQFEACAEWDEDIIGTGETPDKAVWNLKMQANKHNLWPSNAKT